MTLAQLTYLVALDTHRHFRKAADHCRVAQPSLSTQIRKLEEELGVVLFDRDRKPLAPTPIGEHVITQARIVLAEVEGLRHLVQSATGDLAGELRVGILPTLVPYLLPLLVSRLSGRYPAISFVFEELRAPRIIELIKRDMLDAGLMATSFASRGLIEHSLFDEPLVGYVSKGHRLGRRDSLKPGALSLDDLWLPRDGDGLREHAVHLCRVEQPESAEPKAIRFEGESLEALKRLVEHGDGMTLLPWLAAQEPAPCEKALVKFFSIPAPTRTIRMVYARALLKKPLVNALMAEIVDAVAPLLPETLSHTASPS